ncbi:MAG: antibiotic biosynthesis monooxygenase [Gammaproteobacteria bacterium]|jgi:quinol monooxygenase YgiN|nr:antibiotic biosynthesis monooxygenase [Gammaproteobacteria bacterium]
MITFFALLEVTAGKEGEFEALQRELSELTHQHEPDTLIYDVIKHQEKQGIYAVYARFKDQAAFEYHQKTEFHDRLVPPIFACLKNGADSMTLDFYSHVG